MYTFSIQEPIVIDNELMMIEFKDESEPFDGSQFKLHMDAQSFDVKKLTVFRPRLNLWQDITTMLSPFYVAAIKNELLHQVSVLQKGKIS